MKDEILGALQAAGKPMTLDALNEKLKDKPAIEAGLKELLEENRVLLTRRRKLALPEHTGLVHGRIQGHARGFGFFLPDDKSQDAFVPADAMHGAMHGDRVWARYTDQVSRNGSPEVEVAVISDRAYKKIVGTFEQDSRMGGYVVPDETRVPMDVIILRDKVNKAKAGDKVVVDVLEYPDGRRPMLGAVTEVLGNKNDAGTDILSIIRQFGLQEMFSKSAERQAKLMNKPVTEDERITREDLTNKLIFTIDGAYAKDLDDAISLEMLKNGNYYLGVHIADVAHYVKEGSALDRDALARGTSVYLADRVLPMLPVELSNGICSLNAGVERLTVSCFMEIDAGGKVLRHRLAETSICSKYRLVYDDVTKLLRGDAALIKKYAEILPVMRQLEKLAEALNARRVKRGSIDFDIAEASFSYDNKGAAVEISKAERGIANRIIEECMLIANETVAQHMYDLKCPFLYRVHEKPDKEKLSELNAFLQTLGYGIRNVRDIQPRALQRVLDAARGTKEENVVSKVVLRSMQKARYSEKCLGHFGLAAERYCHFTSPIRRYPDLMGHRIIKMMLHGELQEKTVQRLNDRLPAVAEQTSGAERIAMEAERAVDDLKKCEYMKNHIGEDFDGVISGVVSFGFFVELGNTVEGLVRANTIDDDYYTYDERNYRMVGRSHARIFRLGDTAKIRVAGVNMDTRNIDFDLLNGKDGAAGQAPGNGKTGKNANGKPAGVSGNAKSAKSAGSAQSMMPAKTAGNGKPGKNAGRAKHTKRAGGGK